jgi:hypothetical protein
MSWYPFDLLEISSSRLYVLSWISQPNTTEHYSGEPTEERKDQLVCQRRAEAMLNRRTSSNEEENGTGGRMGTHEAEATFASAQELVLAHVLASRYSVDYGSRASTSI